MNPFHNATVSRCATGMLSLAAFALAALPAAGAFAADAWPSRPIRMIVPLAVGGGTDIATRLVATYLDEAIGQRVVVDNRIGANGIIGVGEAARAPADGYTLVVGSSTTMAANHFMYKNPTFDPMKDFVPLAMLGTIDFALMVPSNAPYKNVQDLVAAAKAEPGKLNYGFGSSAALICGELFNMLAGVDIEKVAYKGSPQSLTDLVGGRIQLVCDPVGTSLPLIQSGQLRPLAVTSKNRNGLAPDVPTMAEAGIAMEYETWAGFFAPANTPRDVVQKLSTEIVKIMSRPDVQAKIVDTGFVPRQIGSTEFGAIHRAEFTRYETLVEKAGLSPE
ncbi:tripartite tricarboxylate transporter substrate binding protein [Bordetella petrii]|nr:tripartite tricarboxylate transporter substrate binding protein [Bordetella petrii]